MTEELTPVVDAGLPADVVAEQTDVVKPHVVAKLKDEASKYKSDLRKTSAELTAANAKLQKLEDANKTETQKAVDKAAALEREVAILRTSKRESDLMLAASQTGTVDVKLMAYEISTAQTVDPEMDVNAFVENLRTSKPYLFTDTNVKAKPALQSGAPGGPVTNTGNKSVDVKKDIQELKRQRSAIMQTGINPREVSRLSAEILAKTAELRKLAE